jgi:two-component system chemotaxis response regulator CheB
MSAQKIRVFIVDDSVIVRRLASEALRSDPDIEVVGTAPDPYLAQKQITTLKPDVLTLDLEMPKMDGLTFLRLIMERHPMPVIVMSSLTQHGSDFALEALRLGAIDILAKPSGPYSFGDLSRQLVEKVRVAAGARARRAPPAAAPARRPHPRPAGGDSAGRFDRRHRGPERSARAPAGGSAGHRDRAAHSPDVLPRLRGTPQSDLCDGGP